MPNVYISVFAQNIWRRYRKTPVSCQTEISVWSFYFKAYILHKSAIPIYKYAFHIYMSLRYGKEKNSLMIDFNDFQNWTSIYGRVFI